MPNQIDPEQLKTQCGFVVDATASGDKTVKIWDSETGKVLQTLPPSEAGWMRVAWSPDGGRLAAGTGDGVTMIWDIAGKTPPRRLSDPPHKQVIEALAWVPDGMQLLTVSGGRTTVWDADTLDKVSALAGDSFEEVLDAQWSKDGKRLATGSSVGKVVVWDSASYNQLASVPGLLGRATTVAWSPSGRQLAVGSNDWIATIWDPQVKTQLLTLPGHTGGVTKLAWSPDGKRVATASQDGTVLVHTVSVRELMVLASKRVTRTLTDDECTTYLKLTACPPPPALPPQQ